MYNLLFSIALLSFVLLIWVVCYLYEKTHILTKDQTSILKQLTTLNVENMELKMSIDALDKAVLFMNQEIEHLDGLLKTSKHDISCINNELSIVNSMLAGMFEKKTKKVKKENKK